MRTKILNSAKLVVKVESDRTTNRIFTVSVFDNRTESYWTKEQIHERGIEWFLSKEDMKETLNWNLNGDSGKYQFKWGMSCKTKSDGTAYIFD